MWVKDDVYQKCKPPGPGTACRLPLQLLLLPLALHLTHFPFEELQPLGTRSVIYK